MSQQARGPGNGMALANISELAEQFELIAGAVRSGLSAEQAEATASQLESAAANLRASAGEAATTVSSAELLLGLGRYEPGPDVQALLWTHVLYRMGVLDRVEYDTRKKRVLARDVDPSGKPSSTGPSKTPGAGGEKETTPDENEAETKT